jgi:aspartyl-tRNA(Asn)/glutamyl-tRNA(Gln) amidotransferase subunit A
VCALKPTHGRISVDGVLPLAPSLDHIGIMANCVRDLAIVFEAVAGPVPDCVGLVDSGPESLKLFRLREYFDEADAELLDGYRASLQRLGPPSDETLSLPVGFARIPDAQLTLMAVEAAAFHRERLSRRQDDYPPKIRELIETGLARAAVELQDASVSSVHIRRRFKKRLGEYTVLMTPATRDYAPTRETTGSPAFNSPWSFLGYPTVSVPSGRSAIGLPHSVQFIARDDNESHLLASAAWAERQFNHPCRLPPVPG